MFVSALETYSPLYIESNDTIAASRNKKEENLWTTESNGKIDSTIHQGFSGDCALITTILGLADTDEGAKAIKDSIKVTQKNGKTEYVVTFKGINESYTITQAQLDGANKQWDGGKTGRYSYGDNDMTILELAIEKALNKSKNKELRYLTDNYTMDNLDDKLNGVNPASVAYLLMGEDSDWYTKTKSENSVSKFFNANQDYTTTDVNGNKVTINDNNYYLIYQSSNTKGAVSVYDPKTGKSTDIKNGTFANDVSKKDRNDDITATKQAFKDFEKNNNSMAIIFAVNNESEGNQNKVKDKNGKDVQLSKEAHAYNVKSVKDGVVTLVNPHDTSLEIEVTLESLLNLTSYDCFTVDLSKTEDEKEPVISNKTIAKNNKLFNERFLELVA